MRYLRLIWTLVSAAFGNQKAQMKLRRDMSTLRAIDGVMEPYRRGDYEAALAAAENFRFDGDVSPSYTFYRGSCLAHLGRISEAEVWLRRNIELRKPGESRHVAIGYTTLGHLLLQAGRYDEAVECFEASIRTFPERSSGYRSMAETFLLRGADPVEALRWVRLAVDKAIGDTAISGEVRRLNLGETFATMAWATAAASHDATEVQRQAAKAIESAGATSVSTTAQVRYQCGRAFEVLGDHSTGAVHFQEAAKLDPQGEWGRAARAALTANSPA